MQPTLTTPRLTLRPAAEGDLDALHAIWAAPQVRRHLFDDEEVTWEMAQAALEDARALGASGLGLWVLEPSEAPVRVLGCVGLFPVRAAAEHDPRIAGMTEPMAALAPSAWGRGYAAEAMAALLAYAADTLRLDRLAGVTDVPNVASDRMLRRAAGRDHGAALPHAHLPLARPAARFERLMQPRLQEARETGLGSDIARVFGRYRCTHQLLA